MLASRLGAASTNEGWATSGVRRPGASGHLSFAVRTAVPARSSSERSTPAN
jgi:hypothetical protein